MAHFHIPRPLHGWREFVGEVGIIVLGVLIALGFEQVASRFTTGEPLRTRARTFAQNSRKTSVGWTRGSRHSPAS